MKSINLLLLCLVVTVILSTALAGPRNGKSGRKRKKQKEAQQSELPPPPPPEESSYLDPDDSYPGPGAYHRMSPHLPDFAEIPDDYGLAHDYLSGSKPAVPSSLTGGPSALQPTHTCEPIRIDTCKGIGYNVTSMPNFVGHEMQADADLQLQTFMPLISYGCSSQLKFFLCSVYVPMCTEKVPVIIGPCRPLCESVQSRCGPVLQDLGFPWPEALNCSKFAPSNTVDQMCMEGPPPDYLEAVGQRPESPLPGRPAGPIGGSAYPSFGQTDLEPQPPALPPQLPPYPGLPTNLHPPGIQEPGNPRNSAPTAVSGPSSSNPKSCSSFRHSEHYVFLDLPQQTHPCVPKCASNLLFSSENKQFVDYWTAVWSGLAILSCSFTLLTFTLSPAASFRYPERAVVYIAVCYLLYSLTYLYRAVVGRVTMSCHQEATSSATLLVTEGAYNPHCTLSFLTFYYFGMAGAAWWLVLALTWALAIALRTSPEQLATHSTLYHTFAWCLPAVQALAALVLRAVDADELTGTCFVGAQDKGNLLRFVLLPILFYLATGVAAIVGALLFVRFVYVHGEDEFCVDCHGQGAGNSGGGSPTPTQGTELFLGGHGDADTDPGTVGSLNDEVATSGCGDFCRRICGGGGGGSGSGTGSGHLTSAQCTGSGQSLLLPHANQFATVSSTSSYSSSGGGGHAHHGYLKNQSHLVKGSQQAAGQRVYPSLARSTSTRASTTTTTRRGPGSQTGARRRQQRRVFHLRRRGTARLTTQPLSLFQPVLPAHNSSQADSDSGPDSAQQNASALIRAAIFAIFYLLPAVCVLAAYIYEYTSRDSWLFKGPSQDSLSSSSAANGGDVRISLLETEEPNRPNFEVFNMKLFMSLVIGINTGIWVLTAKSPLQSWRCVFWRCFMKKMIHLPGGQTGGIPGSASGAITGQPGNLHQNSHHFATVLNGGGAGFQTTLPVHPLTAPTTTGHSYGRHHANRPLPLQPQPPTTPTYPLGSSISSEHHHHHPHQPTTAQQQQQQFFFMSDLNGPSTAGHTHLQPPTYPYPGPACNGSTGTGSTAISGHSHPAAYYNGNLVLENPSALGTGQWTVDAGHCFPQVGHLHRAGNETAV